jgi:hypothetical protein
MPSLPITLAVDRVFFRDVGDVNDLPRVVGRDDGPLGRGAVDDDAGDQAGGAALVDRADRDRVLARLDDLGNVVRHRLLPLGAEAQRLAVDGDGQDVVARAPKGGGHALDDLGVLGEVEGLADVEGLVVADLARRPDPLGGIGVRDGRAAATAGRALAVILGQQGGHHRERDR